MLRAGRRRSAPVRCAQGEPRCRRSQPTRAYLLQSPPERYRGRGRDADGATPLLPPAGPQAQGWTGKSRTATVSVWLKWGGILAPSARTGLADLAPGVKVVQTVVCSTFTPGAKPAPRRVADGERMNPPRECAFAQIPEDHEHQGDEYIKRRTRPQMTCPLRARSAGQRRGLTGTSGQPVTPAHVRKAGRPAAHTGLLSSGSSAAQSGLGSHAGSHTDEQPWDVPDVSGQPGGKSPR